MKKILLMLMICATAAFGFYGLSEAINRGRHRLREDRAIWLTQTQQLAEVRAEMATLTEKIRDLKQNLQPDGVVKPGDRAVLDFLLNGDLKSASPEMQDKLLAEVNGDGHLSGSYVLVSKAALGNATLRPLKKFPDGEKLSEAARNVLAITPEEQQTVEGAFAEALGAVAEWAKANVRREGPTEDMLVRYTIPADPAFEEALTNRLFSTINAAIGNERGALMSKFFSVWRLYEDGAIGERTNVFSLHRISGQPGLGYRAGWEWRDNPRELSSAINTFPEPIKPERFPYSFLFVFPGGWQEVAQREGFELPEEFHTKN
jgi:hypothetical protein